MNQNIPCVCLRVLVCTIERWSTSCFQFLDVWRFRGRFPERWAGMVSSSPPVQRSPSPHPWPAARVEIGTPQCLPQWNRPRRLSWYAAGHCNPEIREEEKVNQGEGVIYSWRRGREGCGTFIHLENKTLCPLGRLVMLNGTVNNSKPSPIFCFCWKIN